MPAFTSSLSPARYGLTVTSLVFDHCSPCRPGYSPARIFADEAPPHAPCLADFAQTRSAQPAPAFGRKRELACRGCGAAADSGGLLPSLGATQAGVAASWPAGRGWRGGVRAARRRHAGVRAGAAASVATVLHRDSLCRAIAVRWTASQPREGRQGGC